MEINTRCSAASPVPLQTTRRNRTVKSGGIKGRYECMEVKALLLYHTFGTKEKSYERGWAIARHANFSI